MSGMTKVVDTAVLPVAGVGSRMLPITAAIEKCMLPVAGRPLIDYTVQDCQAADIKRIIFICSERGEQQLRDYFGEIPDGVATWLRALGKTDLLEREQQRRQSYGMTFEYIQQDPAGEYGSVVPLYLAKDSLIDSDYFAYLMGDDFIYRTDGGSELADAMDAWRQRDGAKHLILSNTTTPDEAVKYAVMATDAAGNLSHIVEKPARDQVPEAPMINLGKYVLHRDIWQLIETEMQTPRTLPDEHSITTHVFEPAVQAGQTFYVHPITGMYLDGGSPSGLAQANTFVTEHGVRA